MALPIMIDCDPGHDDAIALVLALASPELEVKAVTASAGNQTPEKTLRNVLRMLTLLNRPDIPVAGGAWKPLMRDLIIADNVHGESGLDGPSLPEPAFAPQNCTAVELMTSVLRESQEPVTLVVTGPQTNVALLLASHPELHAKIARIVIMGGAMGLGNWQPAAEFNIYVDPQAAEMVFQSGIPVVMVGLRRRAAARSLLHRLAPQAGDLYHDRTLGWRRNGRQIYPGDDGGRLLPSDRQSAQYHPDAGCGPRSLCRSARPAVSLLRLTPMPGPFSLAEKGACSVEARQASRPPRRGSPPYRSSRLLTDRSAPAVPGPDRRSAVRDI